MGKKLISFSLYGRYAFMYQFGALRNIELQRELFPDWICRFYVADDLRPEFIDTLRESGAEVVLETPVSGSSGAFWRFRPAAEDDVDVLIVRDTDSRLSLRDRWAVDDWLASGRGFHIMRDHPGHRDPILAGLWGCRRGVLPDLADLIERWTMSHRKGNDQTFLARIVYHRVRNDALIHSDFVRFEGETITPFPRPRDGLEFVGEVYLPEFLGPSGFDDVPLQHARDQIATASLVTHKLPTRARRFRRRLARRLRRIVPNGTAR